MNFLLKQEGNLNKKSIGINQYFTLLTMIHTEIFSQDF